MTPDAEWIPVEERLPTAGEVVECMYAARGGVHFLGYRVIGGNAWDTRYVAPGGRVRTVAILTPDYWRPTQGESQ